MPPKSQTSTSPAFGAVNVNLSSRKKVENEHQRATLLATVVSEHRAATVISEEEKKKELLNKFASLSKKAEIDEASVLDVFTASITAFIKRIKSIELNAFHLERKDGLYLIDLHNQLKTLYPEGKFVSIDSSIDTLKSLIVGGKGIAFKLAKDLSWAKKGERTWRFWLSRPLVKRVSTEILYAVDKLLSTPNSDNKKDIETLKNILTTHEESLKGKLLFPWNKKMQRLISDAKKVLETFSSDEVTLHPDSSCLQGPKILESSVVLDCGQMPSTLTEPTLVHPTEGGRFFDAKGQEEARAVSDTHGTASAPLLRILKEKNDRVEFLQLSDAKKVLETFSSDKVTLHPDSSCLQGPKILESSVVLDGGQMPSTLTESTLVHPTEGGRFFDAKGQEEARAVSDTHGFLTTASAPLLRILKEKNDRVEFLQQALATSAWEKADGPYNIEGVDDAIQNYKDFLVVPWSEQRVISLEYTSTLSSYRKYISDLKNEQQRCQLRINEKRQEYDTIFKKLAALEKDGVNTVGFLSQVSAVLYKVGLRAQQETLLTELQQLSRELQERDVVIQKKEAELINPTSEELMRCYGIFCRMKESLIETVKEKLMEAINKAIIDRDACAKERESDTQPRAVEEQSTGLSAQTHASNPPNLP